MQSRGGRGDAALPRMGGYANPIGVAGSDLGLRLSIGAVLVELLLLLRGSRCEDFI